VNSPHLSTELRLCLDCCRGSFRNAPRVNTQTYSGQVEWAQVLKLARFHGIQGVVWSKLKSDPAALSSSVGDVLQAEARGTASASLQAAVASGVLLNAFAHGGLPLLFLKGLTLATLAYGTIALKSSVDIDILVAEEDVASAADVLRSLGYRQTIPSAAHRLALWHQLHKESVWVSSDDEVQVDLHSRLADNRRLLRSIGAHSPAQSVEVSPGLTLPTLAHDDLFAYLAVHGASSAWFRLKWISDFAALVAELDPDEIDRRYRHAQKLGAGRAAAQALLLADYLFGSLSGSPSLMAELKSDRAHRVLLRAAVGQVIRGTEPTEDLFGTTTIHWTQFLLQRSIGFKASELLRQLRDAAASRRSVPTPP
jgi:Uncharacterised nucleotidyltransferase